MCIGAGIGVQNFPFRPYSFPAGCHELLAEGGDFSLFANHSQRSVDLPTDFGEYKTFRASTALEVRGRLVRRASLILDDVDPSFPCPGTRGSLSKHHEIVIDSRPPRVDYVVSLRSPDAYRAGEVVDLQVVFTQPITVSGPPGSMRLALNVRSAALNGTVPTNGTNSSDRIQDSEYTTYARHDPGCSMRNEGFSMEDRSICFTYQVRHGDLATPFLDYRDEDSLELRNASVYRTATELLQRAVILLPDHSEIDIAGVEAFQRVASVEVVLRGLSHDDASDLQVAVEHSGRRATLMDGRLAKRGDLRLGPRPPAAFSDYRTPSQNPTPVPYDSPAPNSSTSTLSPPDPWNTQRHASGGGSTYHFGDLAGRNLAAEGRACQSSTRFGAFAGRAIDGNRDPYFVGGGSVTHTGSGEDDPTPWWQLSLRRPSPLGTVRVWARRPEVRVDEVQYIHLHAHTPLDGAGSFRLTMDRPRSDGTVATESSDPIDVDAVASRSQESLFDRPPPTPFYPDNTADRFAGATGERFCVPRVDCRGDSVQAKVEALLAKAFRDTAAGNLRVAVSRGRDSRGTSAGESSHVAHEIRSFSPNVDTAELPPSVGSDRRARGKDRAVRQKNLPGTPASELHWNALQGDFDRAWRVTFIGGLGNVPPLGWAAGSGDDADDFPLDVRQAHVGGLTAVGAHVNTATLRQGSHAPAPHGRDDRPRAVGVASAVGTRPGEGSTGPAWLMLFNTTEPPPRGLTLAQARAQAVWSTFLDQGAFEPVGPDDFGGPSASGGGSRPVAVVRVPAIWATHLRIQRGGRSDVETNEVLRRQGLAVRVAAGEVISLESVTEDPSGCAVKDGGSRVPIEEVRAEEFGEDVEGAFDSRNLTLDTTTYTSADYYGFAPLALAEVEVFEEVHAPLHEYAGSSPLPPTVGSSPLSPAIEPLMATFEGGPISGRWVLSVRDRVRSLSASLAADRGGARVGIKDRDGWDRDGWGRRRRVHGAGTLGRWELRVTDVLGFSHTFYMDTTLTVTTLPKFGHLFVTGAGDAADESAELLVGEAGLGEWRRGCAGVDTSGMNGVDGTRVYRECTNNFGVGSKRGERTSGSVAVRRPLRGGSNAALVYVPRVDYTGPDVFQFKVSAGAGLGGTVPGASQGGAVNLHVRSCRKRGGPYFPSDQLGALCACTSPLLFVDASVRSTCLAALMGACGSRRSTEAALEFNNETTPESPVSYRSSGDGRCDPSTGICAPGLPDKVIADPRPNSTSWVLSRELVASGFERMCLACDGSPSFSRLRPRCWAEWLFAMHTYGIRVAVGGQSQCEADVRARGSFDQVRCDDDNFDMPRHTTEPGLEGH